MRIDKTVKFHPINDKRIQKFSLEAFAFLGDHMFVYMHCRVKICNASDPNSRCAQGCIRRAKRAVTTLESKDDEVTLAQGPFMREDSDEKTELQETKKYSVLWRKVVSSKFIPFRLTIRQSSLTLTFMGHIRVPKTLTFNAKVSEKPFLWKWILFAWEQNNFFRINGFAFSASLWNRFPGISFCVGEPSKAFGFFWITLISLWITFGI